MSRIAVLGLDPAGVSGWALWAPREIVASGECSSALERRDVIVAAKVQAQARGLELVAVYEAHHPGAQSSHVLAGLTMARGRWFEQLELAGLARTHAVGVSPGTWRQWAFREAGVGVQVLEELARARCRELGIVASSGAEAAACLIATWGALQSAEVLRIAQQRRIA